MSAENRLGIEVPKIKIDNSITLTGVALERMRTTPMDRKSGASGRILEHLEEKVDIKTDPLEVAIQPGLTEDDRRKRLDVLYSGFHKGVAGIVKRFGSQNEDPHVIRHDLERLVESRSAIVAKNLTPVAVQTDEHR